MINAEQLLPEKFNWQRGYGVFTLGESQLDRAIEYVNCQKAHHQKQTTNDWLERIEADNDGPETARPMLTQDDRIVKEPKSGYEADSVFPF